MTHACTVCGSSDIVIDVSRGDYICTRCGLVLDECVYGNDILLGTNPEHDIRSDTHRYAYECSYLEHRYPCITYTNIVEYMTARNTSLSSRSAFANAMFNIGIQHGVDFKQLRKELNVFFPNVCLSHETSRGTGHDIHMNPWTVAIRHVCAKHSLPRKEYEIILNHCKTYVETHVEHLYHSSCIVAECMYIYSCRGGVSHHAPASIRQCYEKMYSHIIK